MAIYRASLPDDEDVHARIVSLLRQQGINAVILSRDADLGALSDLTSSSTLPQLVLVELSLISDLAFRRCVQECSQLKLPVIAIVPQERLADLDASLGLNDFAVSPVNPNELVARARQTLWRTRPPEDSNAIRIGDLVINPTTYEVSVKGRRIDLRFKEYELLRLLAANPGRVYNRETLLSQIWGYNYFGGTRTVDVHIRRLRSKMEDAENSFIETIWNVGYRFKAQDQTS